MNDYAGLLSQADRDGLEAKLAERERATGTQMAIAIFRSLEGENLEDVASRLFQQWRLGRKGLDNGVLLVVFVTDRKLRIEVGYGLEATIPDAAAGRIIREAVVPRFREQRWTAGLEAAVDAVYARIVSPTADPDRMRKEAESFRRAQKEGEDTARLYLLFFLVLFALIVGSLVLEASRQRHGLTGGRRGWDRTSGGWSGGGWSGGGGGSGGGGFSGGGGGSGGGGASGSW